MTPCKTQHELWYCWHADGKPVVSTIKPDDFESLELICTVIAPNKDVALIVYRANLRINMVQK